MDLEPLNPDPERLPQDRQMELQNMKANQKMPRSQEAHLIHLLDLHREQADPELVESLPDRPQMKLPVPRMVPLDHLVPELEYPKDSLRLMDLELVDLAQQEKRDPPDQEDLAQQEDRDPPDKEDRVDRVDRDRLDPEVHLQDFSRPMEPVDLDQQEDQLVDRDPPDLVDQEVQDLPDLEDLVEDRHQLAQVVYQTDSSEALTLAPVDLQASPEPPAVDQARVVFPMDSSEELTLELEVVGPVPEDRPVLPLDSEVENQALVSL